MVDEYLSTAISWSSGVQIPLWSMNTEASRNEERILTSSDSSMVDEYIGSGVWSGV